MTTFSELGLDADSVRDDLNSMGIDDSAYNTDELESLIFVSNVVFEFAISEQATALEELMANFQIQSDKLEGMSALFANLRDLLDPDEATTTDLMTLVETDYTFMDIDETSKVGLDYTVSSSSSSDSQSYDNLADFISAVSNNEAIGSSGSTVLQVAYEAAEDDSKLTGIYDTSGTEITSVSDGIDELLAGNAYLEISNSHSSAPIHFLDADGFKNYLIALAMQDAEYIGEDVVVEPSVFALTSGQPSFAGTRPDEWAEYYQAFFGKLTINADADAGTLSIDYNGTAGLMEMGVVLEDYFDQADGLVDDDDLVPAYIPTPIGQTDEYSWFKFLTGIYVTGNLKNVLQWKPTNDVDNSNNFPWSALSGDQLNSYDYYSFNLQRYSGYFGGDQYNSLVEDVATALESQSSIGEIALLEISTEFTKWNELHGGWDTSLKYATDAMGRAVRHIK